MEEQALGKTDNTAKAIPTANDARILLEVDRKRRETQCQAAFQNALEEFGCDIDISVVVTSSGNVPQLKVIAK